MTQNNIPLDTIVLTLGFQESEFRELEFSFFSGIQFKPLLMWSTEEDIVESAIDQSSHALFLLVHSSFQKNKLSDASLVRLSSVMPIVVADPSTMKCEGFTDFTQDDSCEGTIIAQRVSFPLKNTDMNRCIVEFANRANLLSMNQANGRELKRTTDLYNEKKLVLNFLTDFIESTNSSINMQEIFDNTKFSFEKIFPLQSLHIAFWNDDISKVNYYLGLRNKNEHVCTEWEEYMHSIIRPIISMKNEKEDYLAPEEEHTVIFSNKNKDIDAHKDFGYNTQIINSIVDFELRPSMGYMLPLDLEIQGSRVGCLILQLDQKHDYGKDIAMAIELACSHLALVFEKIATKPTSAPFMQKQSLDTKGRNFLQPNNIAKLQ